MSRFKMTVHRTAMLALVAFGLVVLGFRDTVAAQSPRGEARAKAQRSSLSAPTSPRPRARTRIRVTPVYPYRLESLPYPTPYPYEYPGPNAVRQCTARLVPEYRPSGTVIVPVTRCWWEQG
jgi:hypothetical protein